MFKLSRHRSEKSGEKLDFKLSHIQALQVPKGWDKLFVSVISVETGKTVTKSGKASVRNGTCHWKETLSESIWLLRDSHSKEMDECLFKLVVSMGSARSGILGEAVINLAAYASSKTSVPLSLPLKKCNYGTILQVKIHCLNPRTELRDEQWQETTSNIEDLNADPDEIDNKSDVSDNTYAKSVGSSSSNHLGRSSHPGELGSRNPSFSASGSRHSSDSMDGSVDRPNFSPRINMNGDLYSSIGRQDSSGSHNGALYGTGPVDDFSRSNLSSFNSRFSVSGNNLYNQRQDLVQNSNSFGTSSLKNANSSKDLLDATEATIDELRAEAKMWERNARKLMLDLEVLRKEFSEQSRNQADIDMELSATCAERDGLKQEIEQLKILLEESRVKQMAAERKNTQEGNSHLQKEFEDEMKFHKESNADLALQLKKTQESNLELVSILQELEETVEKQRLEIDNLSADKLKFCPIENKGNGNEDASYPEEIKVNLELQLQESRDVQEELRMTVHSLEKIIEERTKELEFEKKVRQDMLNVEAEWKSKLSIKEEENSILEAKISNLFDAQGSMEVRSADGNDSALMNEIEVLKEKVRELEADCNELTEENLELILKLKESKKDLVTDSSSFDSLSPHLQPSVSPTHLVPGVDQFNLQIIQHQQEVAEAYGVATSDLQEKFIDLQNKFTDLELQFQSSEDKAHDLDFQLRACHVEIEDREMKISSLKQHLESYQERETNKENEKLEPPSPAAFTEVLSELYEQLQLSLALLKKHKKDAPSLVNSESETGRDALVGLNDVHAITQEEQARAIINNFHELNKLVELTVYQSKPVLQQIEAKESNEDIAGVQQNSGDCNVKENAIYCSTEELNNLKMLLETKVTDLSCELEVKRSEIEELEASLSLKEEEIQVIKGSQTELESQILTNDMLERKLAELENGKCEVELHLSELEEENVQLSERISGLEAQLRYLTDEKESSRLELENSRAQTNDLQNEIKKMSMEMEAQKVDLRQKLQDMQLRWEEAQEECEYLKRANPKLQATAESLIEECTSVQKLNGELRKQKLELHERCSHLESELRECRNNFSDCCKKVEMLESKLSAMQDEVASKEKLITSELDAILHENKEYKEKLIMGESLLNQMYLEKSFEVENLQREVAHLTEQTSSTHDEREKIASNAVFEVSTLRADNVKLKTAVQEAKVKAKSSEIELHHLRLESERKVQELMKEIHASKQNLELLTAEHQKLQRLLDDVKSSEERFKSIVSGLELQLTACQYERQQLMEETASLKVQLQKIPQLQDDIVTLKNSLSETSFEKDRLEASLQLLSGDCEDLKTQRDSCAEKLSSLQKSVSEIEDCRRSRIALEEKILRLEGDLTVKEALCAQDAELKNELSRIKRANSQFQRKLHSLEEEKNECVKKVNALEEELKLHKEERKHHYKSDSRSPSVPESDAENLSNGKLEFENGMEDNNSDQSLENAKIHDSNERSQELTRRQHNLDAHEYQREGEERFDDSVDQNQIIGADLVTKLLSLETELAEALEANNMYKAQLKELLTDRTNGHAHTSKKSSESEVLSNGQYRVKISSLETELKDIRERYFNMSLKYAEVEAQREELVMKMRPQKSGKGWFS
ncbi:hypothetical protein Syun_000664 [Stephania yunnanensis]|uniref:C2 NT-type domain-containing protein n=1 Tax=Stephania yunnanensis TaxID=152371 RepID=A0AAP0LGE0_9MAGN